MRQIILDTETTGLDPQQGDRVVELGCVELLNRRLTGNNKHYYLNPQRQSDEKALKIHGLSAEFLSDKPTFDKIVEDFLAYMVGVDEVIIHNAPFDVGFLDAELSRTGHGRFSQYAAKVVDSMALAKKRFPGKRHSLDALCTLCGLNHTGRELHGALLDAQLLAQVYLFLTQGQEALSMDMDSTALEASLTTVNLAGLQLPSYAPSPEELLAHEAVLAVLDKHSNGKTLWRRQL